MTEPRVRLLVLSTCLQCKALQELLKANGIAYETTVVDLMLKEEREELFRQMAPYNEKKAFPVTFIGEKAIIGFQKQLILEELGLN
ncbi:MAG: glutaredoxin family protein [Desulfofustis sp.]|jgi:glutaredoxin|nr:glutaredoxin family protein [Desulfofustis sp.]